MPPAPSSSRPSSRHVPPPPPALTGAERFVGIEATVAEFWSYAMRDLRSNAVRGVLAEWWVARAVGVTQPMPSWHEFDVLTPSGVRVEVKAGGYLQSWPQRSLSRIVFGGLRGRVWDRESGRSGEPTYNADVYVLCVQTAQRHDEYDPLDVGQWAFHVLPRSIVAELGRDSLGLGTVQRLVDLVAYADLARAIEDAGASPSADG